MEFHGDGSSKEAHTEVFICVSFFISSESDLVKSYLMEVGPLSREEMNSSMHFITKCHLLSPYSSAGTPVGRPCGLPAIQRIEEYRVTVFSINN